MACTHPAVRVVVPDSRERPLFARVAQARPQWIRTVVAGLDMDKVYEEVSTEAGNLDTPAGAFRHAYVQIGSALGHGDMAAAEKAGAQAVQIARGQSWSHLVVAAHFALGAGYLGRRDFPKAMGAYREAEQATLYAQARGESYARSLQLKVRLAMGAVFVTAELFPQGAKVYADSAPLAEELGDLLMLLECRRMASYCHERAGAVDAAWEQGVAALAVGRRMDEATRRSSTLAYLGERMRRLANSRRFRHFAQGVEQQMRQLLGEGWPALTQPGAVAPEQVAS